MDEKNEIKIINGALAFLKIAMDDARHLIDATKE
jgi:hypothetical protein